MISPETEVRGTITSSGVLEINGQVRGDILHEGHVIVGKRGFCISNIRASSLLIRGKVHGVVTVAEALEIDAGGRLFGDAYCDRLIVHNGAILQGNSHMAGAGPEIQDPAPQPLPLPASAPAALFSMAVAEPDQPRPEPDGQTEAEALPFYGSFSAPPKS